MINADGAPLEDRFAEGWTTSDVAATDPGVADGAAAGLHALVNGSLVAMDAQRVTRARGLRTDAGADGGRRITQRASGGLGGDAGARGSG